MPNSESSCRACGHHVHVVPPFVLEGLGVVGVVPEFIEGLCVTCLEQVRVPQDPDGYPTRCVTQDDVNAFLVDRLRLLSQRMGAGHSILRCEVMTGHWSSGLVDVRCQRFANKTHEGRHICGICLSSINRGRKLTFTKEEAVARTFTIYALTPAELMKHALRYAREWNAALKADAAPSDPP